MKSAVRRMGNSSAVIIPKSLLAEFGAHTGDAVDVAVDQGRLVIVRVSHPRDGWEDDARRIAESGEEPAWPDFGNDGDAELTW